MVNPCLPRSLAEALGTGAIPDKLSAILAAPLWKVCEDGAALILDKRLVRGGTLLPRVVFIGVDLIPGMEQVRLFGVDLDGIVHLLHSLFSVRVNLYSASRRIFACQGDLPAKGLPPVVEISTMPSRSGAPFAPCREWNT